MLQLIDSCQNKVSANQYHTAISQAQVMSSSSSIGSWLKLGGLLLWGEKEVVCAKPNFGKLTPAALFTFLPTYSLQNRILKSP